MASDSAAVTGTSPSAVSPPPEDKVDYKQMWLATDALVKTKEMRNYFQLERDKINAFWEITKREVEMVKAELRNKDSEKEEMKERHQVEMKVFKQKMRHVLYEQNAQVVQLKTEAERALKVRMEEHRGSENDLRQDVRQLKQSKKELELQLRDEVMRSKQKHAQELTDQLRDHEQTLREMQIKYEKRVKLLREDMETRRKFEIDTIEKRKAEHIRELRTTHDKAFNDIKDYYNNITSSNLDTINQLKDQVTLGKRNEAANEKMMFEIAHANRRLTEPLTKALNEQSKLKEELTNYERDKSALKTAKQQLEQLERRHKTLTWEHEVLGQRFQRLCNERDEIFDRYQTVLNELEQKAIFKQVLLHKKVEVVQSQLERKDAQLGEVLKTANMDPAAVEGVTRKLEDMVNRKNKTIEDLQHLLANVTKRHEDIVSAYETYLTQNGVPGLSQDPASNVLQA